MEKSTKTTLGLIIIVIGIIGLLNQIFGLHIIEHISVGPIIILGLGLWFEYMYFSRRRNPGLLVPGGILTTIGCIEIFNMCTGYFFSGYTDAFYVLAPAIGLFQLYLFGKQSKGLLIPVGILTTVAAVDLIDSILGSAFHFMNRSILIPIALVVLGCVMIFTKKDVADDYDKKSYK